jgi:hypothetical protein
MSAGLWMSILLTCFKHHCGRNPVSLEGVSHGNRIGISRENQLIFEMNVRFFRRVNIKLKNCREVECDCHVGLANYLLILFLYNVACK